MFRMILFVLIVVSFVFHNWIGKLYQWMLSPMISSTFGAVFIGCCLIFTAIGLWNLFVGKTELLGTGRRRTIVKTTKGKN